MASTFERNIGDFHHSWRTLFIFPRATIPLQIMEVLITDYTLDMRNSHLDLTRITIHGMVREYQRRLDIPNDEASLALAVLAGDRKAALFLADKVLETYHST